MRRQKLPMAFRMPHKLAIGDGPKMAEKSGLPQHAINVAGQIRPGRVRAAPNCFFIQMASSRKHYCNGGTEEPVPPLLLQAPPGRRFSAVVLAEQRRWCHRRFFLAHRLLQLLRSTQWHLYNRSTRFLRLHQFRRLRRFRLQSQWHRFHRLSRFDRLNRSGPPGRPDLPRAQEP